MSQDYLHQPEEIIQRLLILLGQGSDPATLPLGAWPIYHSREPNTPDNVITMFGTVGLDEGDEMVEGEKGDHPGVTIRVRSATPKVGYVKAQALWKYVGQNVERNQVTIDGAVYVIHSVYRAGSVIHVGKETPSSQRDVFNVNVMITHDRLS